MFGRKSSPKAGGDVGHAELIKGDEVEITLDEDREFLFADIFFSLEKSVKILAFCVSCGFG